MSNQTFQHPPTGLVIIQPALEPKPSGVLKFGRWALFFYVRWSFFGVGFDILPAGFAVHIGPLMAGFAHIDRFLSETEA